MKKLFLSTLLVTVMSFSMAQNHETYQVSLFAHAGAPLGDLKDLVGGSAIGTGFNALFNPKGKKSSSPVFVGLDFSYSTFGRDKQPSTSTAPPYKTSFNDYTISGAIRLFTSQREVGFTPFIDGQLGAKIFNTRTKIDKNLFHTLFNDDQPEVINTTNDVGLGYGIGAGFYTRKALNENGNRGVSFTLRTMYIWGDKASYVKRGSVNVDSDGFVTFETAYSNTNMVLVQLGIVIPQ